MIIELPRKGETVAYIALSRDGKSYRESKTFDGKPAAAAWIKKREAELHKPGGLDAAKRDKRNPTIGDAIDRYVLDTKRTIGRTKGQRFDRTLKLS